MSSRNYLILLRRNLLNLTFFQFFHNLSDLVVVRNFGDPIYPALIPLDRVQRGGPDKPWHVLT